MSENITVLPANVIATGLDYIGVAVHDGDLVLYHCDPDRADGGVDIDDALILPVGYAHDLAHIIRTVADAAEGTRLIDASLTKEK